MTHRSTGTAARRLAALAAIGALALAGCGGDDGGDTPSGDGGGGSVEGSTIELGVPITEAGDSPYKLAAEAYMEQYPDREVVVTELPNDGFAQALNTQLQAGTAPDIVYVTPGGGNPQALLPIAAAGYLEPLTGTSADTTIPESSRPAFYLDDVLYGQGLDLTVVSLVRNVTAMDADGVALPPTYAELLDLCQSVADADKSVFVVAGALPPNTGLTSLAVAASRVYAPTPDWNQQRAAGDVTFAGSQEWVDSLDALVEMQQAGCFQDGVEGGDFAAITTGLGQGTSYAAFVPSGAAFQLQTETGSEFVVDVLPGVTEDSTLFYASVNNALALTEASENKDAAKAFLDWLAQPATLVEYAGWSGNLPLGEIDASTLPEEFAPIADRIAAGDYVPLPSQEWPSGEVYTELGTGVQGLFTGQATTQQVLESMDAAWDRAAG